MVLRILKIFVVVVGVASALVAVIAMAGIFSMRQDFPAGAAQALAKPDHVVLYSIGPYTAVESNEAEVDHFQIKGRVELNPAQTAAIVRALEVSLPRWRFSVKSVLCFHPRFVLQIMHQGKTVDFIICYECLKMKIFAEGAEIASLEIEGSPKIFDDIFAKVDALSPVVTSDGCS